MIQKSILTIVVIAAFISLPFASKAWGTLGHRIVGEVAAHHLSPKAKQAVKQILGDESIAMASTWADFVKSDTSFKYLNSWHYIDFDDTALTASLMVNKLKNDSATDAYVKLNFLIAQLKNKNLNKEKQLMYLRLLIHIVGDIHQPLHTGRTEDKGGNTIKVSWFNQPTNLHAVWDEKMIDNQQLSYTEYTAAIDHPSIAQITTWQGQPLSTWIFQTYQLANAVYAEIKPDQKLSYRYSFDHLASLNEQLLKGGIRLAGLLNEIFG